MRGENDELEKTLTDKDTVVALLMRALKSAKDAIIQTDEPALAEPLTRRAYMRMIAQTHEHMGQVIAYTQTIGLTVPWPDWRACWKIVTCPSSYPSNLLNPAHFPIWVRWVP